MTGEGSVYKHGSSRSQVAGNLSAKFPGNAVNRSFNTLARGQFLQASESTNAQGQHVLRVIATGMVAELPIQWNYYLVTSPDGHRVAFAFTLEQNLVERFAEADQSLVDSVEFGGSQQSASKEGVTKR